MEYIKFAVSLSLALLVGGFVINLCLGLIIGGVSLIISGVDWLVRKVKGE